MTGQNKWDTKEYGGKFSGKRTEVYVCMDDIVWLIFILLPDSQKRRE